MTVGMRRRLYLDSTLGYGAATLRAKLLAMRRRWR